MTTKYYYLFIGGGVSELGMVSKRFVVESDGPLPARGHWKGRVVARNKNAFHYLGYNEGTWVNPIEETALGLFPNFVRLPQGAVDEMKFYESEIPTQEQIKSDYLYEFEKQFYAKCDAAGISTDGWSQGMWSNAHMYYGQRETVESGVAKWFEHVKTVSGK